VERVGVDQRLEWLDEQRRKDAAALERLERRLGGLEDQAAKGARQAQELASEVARLAALAARISQFDDALTKHRQEVSRQLHSAEETRTTKEKALEQARRRDQSELGASIQELKAELKILDEIREDFKARREEEKRISRAVDGLAKKAEKLESRDEDRGRWILSSEEGRKQDLKRVTDLQVEVTDVRSRLDAARGTLDTVEDRLRRAEVRLSEMTAGESERHEAMALWMEQQHLRVVDFERTTKEWGRRFESFEKMAGELERRMLAYDETYRALRQQREELNALMERLERRITEVGEMQRLMEDRIKQEWATFQGDDQKRWNTYKLSQDELWRDHSRLHERLTKDLQAFDETLHNAVATLGELTGATQKRLLDLLALVRGWSPE
jgi:predicted RNase H-like nuclease (RuvC/YqgF family)